MDTREYIARLTDRQKAFDHIRHLERRVAITKNFFDELDLMHARNNFAALQMLIDNDVPMAGTYAHKHYIIFIAHLKLQLDSLRRKS